MVAVSAAALGLAQNPTIASWSPWSAPVGTTVSIQGSNLGKTTAFYFNNVPCSTVQITSDWGLKVVVPVGATTGRLKVVTQTGSYTTGSDFVVSGVGGGGGGGGGTLKIVNFSPWKGKPCDEILVEGNAFTNNTTVKFGALPASKVTYVSGYRVKAVVPAGAVTAKLTVADGAQSYTGTTDFVVEGTGGGGGGGTSGGGGGGGTPPAFVNPPNIPIPTGAMTGHPRIFIRQADLPMYRSWANANNPVWVAVEKLAVVAKGHMDNNAINDPGWGDGNAPNGYESYAQLFAFMSLMHPNAAVADDYANRARTMLMKVIDVAVLGPANVPFREPKFATKNRASWYGEGFALTVDWIYPKFSAEDKAKIRKVFMRWVQECVRANVTAEEHPRPVGAYNDPALLDDPKKIRWASNNYYANHMRQIALMAMALDEADDVPAAADEPAAGTLRKFVGNVMQAWLYQAKKYEETDGKGAISPEGLRYGEIASRAYAMTLLGLHTTGVDLPAVYGPQAGLINSDYWQHQVPNAYLHMLSPAKVVQDSWIGPTHLPYLFSDSDQYRNTDFVRVFGPLAIHARITGDMARYTKLRWMIDNLPPGGVANRDYAIHSALAGASVTKPIMYFLAVDPNMAANTDPRPALPTEYWGSGLGVLLSRPDWTPGASWFVSKASWNTVDHQFGDAMSFGFYRGGEWLTKPHLGYGPKIARSDYQNTLAIENAGSTGISFWVDALERGSQFAYNSYQDPTNVMASWGTGDAFTQADATPTYNNPKIPAMDVAHASRASVFLKPDVVVTYDRAKTAVANRYKRYWINLPASATVNGREALMTTTLGQRLFVSTLLPTTAVLSVSAKESLGGEPAQMDPMTHRLLAEDPAKPQEVRFLNVLQGANAGGAKLPTATLASTAGTAGTAFDGASVGTTSVLFKRDMFAAFAGTTFKVPAGTTKTLVTGLTPNGSYTVTTQADGTWTIVTVAAGGPLTADSAGVLVF